MSWAWAILIWAMGVLLLLAIIELFDWLLLKVKRAMLPPVRIVLPDYTVSHEWMDQNINDRAKDIQKELFK